MEIGKGMLAMVSAMANMVLLALGEVTRSRNNPIIWCVTQGSQGK
jgi:hypothetical protein